MNVAGQCARFLRLSILTLTVLLNGSVMANSDNGYIVEYFRSFSGYEIPLRLVNKIAREEAEANAADAAYYIGYFRDESNKGKGRTLVRVVKMFRGSVLFEHRYYYHENGKLKRKEVTNEHGTLTIQEFDESGKLVRNP